MSNPYSSATKSLSELTSAYSIFTNTNTSESIQPTYENLTYLSTTSISNFTSSTISSTSTITKTTENINNTKSYFEITSLSFSISEYTTKNHSTTQSFMSTLDLTNRKTTKNNKYDVLNVVVYIPIGFCGLVILILLFAIFKRRYYLKSKFISLRSNQFELLNEKKFELYRI